MLVCPEQPGSFGRSGYWSLPALAASRGDLGVNLPHGDLMKALALRFRANCSEPRSRWGKRIDVIVNAHDDCLWFSAAVNQKTLVFLNDSPEDLSKLRGGS